MRRPFIAGNWKMNLTLAESRELMAGLREGLPTAPPPASAAHLLLYHRRLR